MLSARGEESKPVAHPCRGPGGQAGDHQKRQGPPFLARETWLAPNVIGAWGVTRSETETQRRFTFPSRLATKTGNSYDLIDSIEHARISWGLV